MTPVSSIVAHWGPTYHSKPSTLWLLTWSCSRCDVDSLIAVNRDSLVGVIVWVICEHLQYRKKRLFLAQEWKYKIVFQPLPRTRITHRVSPGLKQSQFPCSEKEMNRDEELTGRFEEEEEQVRVKQEYLHWFILTVGAEVYCGAVFELNHDEILPGITLRWSHTYRQVKVVNKSVFQDKDVYTCSCCWKTLIFTFILALLNG